MPRAASSSPPTRTPRIDFGLQTTPVRWSDISIEQGRVLLPDARGKQTLFQNCLSCHGFQSRMAAVTARRGRLARPRQLHARGHALLARRPPGLQRPAGRRRRLLSQHVRRRNSVLPKSPADLPFYKDTVIRSATRRSRSSMSITRCRGRTASRGPRIPTRTAISGRRNTAPPTGSPASTRRPAR